MLLIIFFIIFIIFIHNFYCNLAVDPKQTGGLEKSPRISLLLENRSSCMNASLRDKPNQTVHKQINKQSNTHKHHHRQPGTYISPKTCRTGPATWTFAMSQHWPAQKTAQKHAISPKTNTQFHHYTHDLSKWMAWSSLHATAKEREIAATNDRSSPLW